MYACGGFCILIEVYPLDLVEVIRFDVAVHLGPTKAGFREMDAHHAVRLDFEDRSLCPFFDIGSEHAVFDLDERFYVIAPFEGYHNSPLGVDSSPWSSECT